MTGHDGVHGVKIAQICHDIDFHRVIQGAARDLCDRLV